MGYKAKKTEHAGPKRGTGAYCGPKKDAKKESGKIRRRNAQRDSRQELRETVQAPDWLNSIGEASLRRGTDRLTAREIDAIIADTRRDLRNKVR